jgi:putative transposase
MKSQRKRHSADFKAKVALEAIKGQRPINEIAAKFQVHPNQITQWKKQMLDALPSIFSDRRLKADRDHEQLEASLYQQIGQLKVELDWLKKKVGYSSRE